MGAIPSFPSDLPQQLTPNGYNEAPADLWARNNPTFGPALVNKVATAGISVLTGNLELGSLANAQELFVFWRDTLKRGSLFFSWALVAVTLPQGTPETQYAGLEDVPGIEDISGMEDLSTGGTASGMAYVRFQKAPRFSCDASGLVWTAALVLEVMP
jgi:hypothetical protein